MLQPDEPIEQPSFHDLDHLAGGWSDEDVKVFEENTFSFKEIDPELWP